MPKTKKKVVTKKKTAKRRPGRPKGSKNAKKAGRPKKKAGRPRKTAVKAGNSIQLFVDKPADITYWSEMVTFLNDNKGRSFTVTMDGVRYTLKAG